MKILLAVLMSAAALHADSTVCSAGPSANQLTPVSCDAIPEIQLIGPLPINASIAVGPQSITGRTGYYNFSGDGSPYQDYQQIQFSFDDSVAVPAAAAGDVLKITANGSAGLAPNSYGFELSFGMTAGPFTFTPTLEIYCAIYDCQMTATIPAAQIPSLSLYGSGSFLVGPDLNGALPTGGAFEEDITLQLFKADGVTPDVFIPEPSSLALGIFGILLAAVLLVRRRFSR